MKPHKNTSFLPQTVRKTPPSDNLKKRDSTRRQRIRELVKKKKKKEMEFYFKEDMAQTMERGRKGEMGEGMKT